MLASLGSEASPARGGEATASGVGMMGRMAFGVEISIIFSPDILNLFKNIISSRRAAIGSYAVAVKKGRPCADEWIGRVSYIYSSLKI